ncbi:hypothetical protein FJTKL_06539 [Diaporthe vaccinii]|uniref:DUF7025 domain-containing protein n=1 Tax=Diaporthe vaccinii TaxID=105482 RepID=A0ABR4DQ22_9PEZI
MTVKDIDDEGKPSENEPFLVRTRIYEEDNEDDGGDEDKEDEADQDANEEEEEEEEGKEDNNDGLSPDLELLIHWAEKYYSSVQEELDAVMRRGKIRFELLWAFIEPEDELYLQCPHTEVPMCVTYQSGQEAEDRNHQRCFSLVSRYLNRAKDGQPGYSIRTLSIPYFWGEKDIRDLNVYPLEHHAQEKQIRTELIARGRKYAKLSKVLFSHQRFCGNCFVVNANSEVVVRYAKSRIVLDPDEFAKYPPGKSRVPHAVRLDGDMTWDKLADDDLLICVRRR